MDYVYYILAVLLVGLLCMCAIRLAVRSQNGALLDYHKRRAAPRGHRRAGKSNATKPVSSRPGLSEAALSRQAGNIKAPWGWPSHGLHNGMSHQAFSARLHTFADRLMREKQIRGKDLTDQRRVYSIRALIEDRYGRVRHDGSPEIEYRKVRAPRLRDPREPHDQMDNFGTREAEQIRRKLEHVKSMRPAGRKRVARPAGSKKHHVELKDIKQPWGW